MINLEDICSYVVKLARFTGDVIDVERAKLHDLATEQKGKNDFVTLFDKMSERILVDGLVKILPEAGFIAEENTSSLVGETYNWIVDPIDGTTNFIHGLFPYCISIGLKRGDEIILGVIYEFGLKECFYAWEGSSAFLNGKVIRVSNTPAIKDSLVATGFTLCDYQNKEQFFNTLLYFSEYSHGLRRCGSAAANLAYVACGRMDAFYKLRLKSWDVAAGALIVKQAGGQVTDFVGGSNYLFGGELVATNGFVHNEMIDVITQHN